MKEEIYWIIGIAISLLGIIVATLLGILLSNQGLPIESSFEVDCNIGELVTVIKNFDNLTLDDLNSTSNCKISGTGTMPAFMVEIMMEYS